MIKLSRTGITTLKRQYKSVLLKCLLINAGILLAAGSANAAADAITSLPGYTGSIGTGSFMVAGEAYNKESTDALIQGAKDYAKNYADGLASNYDAAGAAATALSDAKNYVDGKGYQTSTQVSTAISNAITALDLANTYDAKGAAATAETNAKAYADGLASNYDAAGSAATAETNAKAYADSLAANYDAAGSATTAETNAKAYAKEYADGLVGNLSDATVTGSTVVAKINQLDTEKQDALVSSNAGNGITITPAAGTDPAKISVNLNETSGSGLVATADGLAVKIKGNSGLTKGSDGLAVAIKEKGGLTADASGLAIVTGNTTKLSDAGALEVKDLQTTDFKSGVIVTTIGDDASDAQLATALATKTAIKTGAEKADYTNTVATTATHISHNTLQGAIADLDTTIGDMSEFDQNNYAKSETSVATNLKSLDTTLKATNDILGSGDTGPASTPSLVTGKIGDDVTVVAALRSVADNAAGKGLANTFTGDNTFEGRTTFNNSNGITIGNMIDSSDAAYKSASITTTNEGALKMGANTEVNGTLKVGAANAISGVAAAGDEPAKLDMGANGLTNVNGLTLTDGETTPTEATISVSKVASVGAVVDIAADVVTSTEFRASSALTVEDASHNEVFVADASGITVGDGTNDTFTVDAATGDVTAAGIGHFGDATDYVEMSAGDLKVTGDALIGGDLDVDGVGHFGDATDYVEMNAGDLEVTGDASIGGALDVDGDLKVGEKFKVTAETGKISAAAGKFLVKEGGLVSAAGGTFLVKTGGEVSAAAGKFVVTEGGRVSAAGGNFIIETDGSFGLNNGKFNVDKDGNTTVKGTLGVDGATTLNDTLTVAKAATLNSTLDVADTATFGDTADYQVVLDKGVVTADQGLVVNAGGANITGDSTIDGTLHVTDAVTLDKTLKVAGDTRIGDKFKVTAETGTLSAAAGTFLVKEGGLVSAAGGTFLVKTGGEVSAAAGKFVVSEGGRLSAAGGNFIIETDGSFGLNNGKFNVDKDGNTTIEGLTTLSADNGMRFGTGQVVKSIDAGADAQTDKNPEALATVATVLKSAENADYTGTAKDATGATPATVKAGLNLIGDVSSFAKGRYISSSENLADATVALDKGLSRLEDKVRDFKKEFKSGMAQMAAMSALVPNARAHGDTQISVGTGAYEGQTAAAFGGFHWINDNLMLNIGASYGDSNNMAYRAGLTWSW